ncbi:MAG: hypothetical protein LBR22_04600 [Desulfovibrio sp.]|jgi:hypothetical protein|nr:hypothetical protein [Desulfovibrio sp.]
MRKASRDRPGGTAGIDAVLTALCLHVELDVQNLETGVRGKRPDHIRSARPRAYARPHHPHGRDPRPWPTSRPRKKFGFFDSGS